MASSPAAFLIAPELLPALLDLSVSGVVGYAPLWDEAGHLRDFAFTYLNPAAQRLLGLPAQPPATYCEQFPEARTNGGLAFHQAAYEAGGEPRYLADNYQATSYNQYFRIAARRVGEQLLVSFTTSDEQDRNPVEQALRDSQTREQAARLEAAAEVRRQRWQWEELFRAAPAGICIFNGPDWVYEFVNPGYQALFPGRTLLGKRLVDALPEIADQPLMQILRRVYETGEPFQAKEVLVPLARTADGPIEDIYFDLTYLARHNEAGQIDGFITYATDVTAQVLARHQAEGLQAALLAAAQHQVQQREDLFQIFEQAPAAIVLLREPNHRIEYVNPTYQQFFPGTPLRGQLLGEAHPRAGATGVLARLDRVYQTGEPYVGEEELIELALGPSQPAQTRYFNFTYQPYREAGRPVGVSIFAYDVTEAVLARRAVVQQLAARQQYLQQLVELVPVAVATFEGPAHQLAAFNQRYQQLVNRPLAVGRPVRELFTDMAGQGFFELMSQLYATGQPLRQSEVPTAFTEVATGEVRTFYQNICYQPIVGADGHSAGLLISSFDVSEQVLARQQVEQGRQQVQELNRELAAINEELTLTNEELHESNTRLTRTNHDLDTFVYTASHDLKAPITNIEGILDALRNTLPAAVQQEAVVAHLLGLLDHTVGRFRTTIDQLTDLTRLQQTYNEPAESLRLAPVVAGVLADLAPQIAAAATQVQVAVPADLQVSFAPASLRSIVYNLLSNAVKYRDPSRPAQVWLRAEPQAGKVVFSVRDNGLGLTDSQQQRLFGVFQRLHTHVEGTGVGLYMIKRLIDNAGASIAVASSPGVGTTFTVLFPV